jgi:hypothetical protein
MLKTFLIGLVVSSSFAQAVQNESPHLMEPRTALVIPESGFISSHHYTNAYFGFGLPLPKGRFGIVDVSHDMWALRHDLLFLRSIDSGLAISATPVLDSAEDEARRISLMGTRSHAGTKIIDIDGRPFWKSELGEEIFGVDTRHPGRKWWRASYAIALRGFVIHFWASSYGEQVQKELQECIESVKFFDPSHAIDRAETDKPFLSQAGRLRLESAPHLDVNLLDPGNVHANAYTNSLLGFSYVFPAGWYPADSATSGTMERIRRWAGAGTIPLAQEQPTERCGRVLSWATKFPEQDPSHGFNSRIVIFAADPMCFAPNVKFPASVHDRSIELFTDALATALSGSSLLPYGRKSVGATSLGGHLFFEIPGAAPIPPREGSLMHRAHRSLVLTTMQDYWIIWLFESETESQVYDLIKSGIIFDSMKQQDRSAH